LRQDADVIVVGECRDRETTTTAIRAALAGHLVVTTVHAPRAREVVPRLLEMGVDADLLLSALRLICTQRLLRRQRGGRQVIVDTLPVDEAARQAWRHSQGETVSLHTDMDRQAAALMEAQAVEPGEVARVLGNAISTP
jgi:type II secretory ATPase GspE/PulE/Tfp pilus assembly ATPase PilB-like protein